MVDGCDVIHRMGEESPSKIYLRHVEQIVAAVNVDDSQHETDRFVLGWLLEAEWFTPICNVTSRYLLRELSWSYVRWWVEWLAPLSPVQSVFICSTYQEKLIRPCESEGLDILLRESLFTLHHILWKASGNRSDNGNNWKWTKLGRRWRERRRVCN